MSKSPLELYSQDFMAFVSAIHVPLADGTGELGPAMAEFQRKDFEALAPALHSLARGEKPETRRFWLERTKGASKDSDLALAMLWLLAFTSRPLRIQVGADDFEQASETLLIVKNLLRIQAPLNALLDSVVTVQARKIVCDRTGSVVEILTRDNSGSHGARPNLVLINELSHIGDEVFAQTLFDNSDKMPGGVMLIATNAGTRKSWQEKWRDIAVESDRWHFSTVQQPAKWISEDDLAES